MSEDRIFYEIEAFLKKRMVSAAISKAGKTSLVEPNTKVNAKYYCNVLLTKMIPDMNRLAKYKEYSCKTELELTQPGSPLKC